MKIGSWETIVDTLKLDLTKPVNFIKAEEIKRVSGEEPRLVAYIDHREELPDILREHNVFPVAVRNGVYALVRGNGFHNLESNHNPAILKSNLDFNLITLQRGSGEDRYLMLALHSGIISSFTDVDKWWPTIRGRMRSGSFDFYVGSSPSINVDGIQFQVDLLLESLSEIMILEGKTVLHDSFLIRQLYYPFRFWSKQAPSKKIRTTFFVYDQNTGIYHLWEYSFKDINDYSSIQLVNAASYLLESQQRTLDEYFDLDVHRIESLPKSFRIPQANDIEKVIEFPMCVERGINDSDSIAEYFEFKPRQSSYYREAAEGLGFVSITKDNTYVLTNLGRNYVSLSPHVRNILFARRLMMHPIFHRIIEDLSSSKIDLATNEYISSIIRENSNLTGTTPQRRASTIRSWFKWIDTTLGLVEVTSEGITLNRSMK